METAVSFRLELRSRKRFFPWNTSSRRKRNIPYAEIPQDLIILALRSSFPIWSSLIALENWFLAFSFCVIWFIIRSAPLFWYGNGCGDLMIPKIMCYFNVNVPTFYIFCLIIQAFAPTLLVGKLSYKLIRKFIVKVIDSIF